MTNNFEDVCNIKEVSRETFEKLEVYVESLLKWNQSINIISRSSVDYIWQRHVLDSLQVTKLIDNSTKTLTDFGSGGGLPGIVVAITTDINQVNLVESDQRKCAFLNEISAKLNLNCKIHNNRIEELEAWQSDIITARALAPLDKLVDLLKEFMIKSKKNIFFKGENVEIEIKKALKKWHFNYKLHESKTSKNAKIIEISDIYKL